MENDRCHVEPLDKPLDESKLATAMAAYRSTELTAGLAVGGMGCPRCAQRVRNGLLGLEGVLLADVFLEQGLAAAAYDPQQLSPDDLVGAVAGAGNPSISSGHSDGRHHYWADVLAVMPATDALAD